MFETKFFVVSKFKHNEKERSIMLKIFKNKVFVTGIVIILILSNILLFAYKYNLKPKEVIKVKTKYKTKETIKKIDSNNYFIHEDQFQTVALLIFNNKFASIITCSKDFNTPLAYLFNSHDLTKIYTVEDYPNKIYLKGEYESITELKKSNKNLIFEADNVKFEKTDLQNIYNRIDRANLLLNSSY